VLRCLLVLGLVLATQPGCTLISDCRTAPCTRVLFIGNSHTAVNDLPGMFAALAGFGGHPVEVGRLAAGGLSLADHVASETASAELDGARWDTVVLQEQSQLPSVDRFRQSVMYPAARELVEVAREAGAEPLFFLTWARRDGWPERGMVGYRGMQSAVNAGYLTIAAEAEVAVAPVGYAWSDVVDRDGWSDLWQADGIHPTVKGTYLAACVFYAAIFLQSPVGLAYHAGLWAHEAARLQEIAADVVLSDPQRWGLQR